MSAYARRAPEKEEWWRPLVSRVTMLVLAAAMLWGGVKCIRTANWLRADHRARVERGEMNPGTPGRRRPDPSGATLPMLAGAVLVLVGGGLGVLAVLPMNLMQMIGPGDTSIER